MNEMVLGLWSLGFGLMSQCRRVAPSDMNRGASGCEITEPGAVATALNVEK